VFGVRPRFPFFFVAAVLFLGVPILLVLEQKTGEDGGVVKTEIIFYSSRWTETWKGLARELALPVCQLRQLLSLTGFVVFCSSACSFLFFFPQIKRLFVLSEKVQMLCFSLSAFLITPSSNGFVI
jgi:hypothetical protein